MPNETQVRKLFLVGVILLIALIIGGIVWAILAGPTPQSANGNVETNLSFSDANDPSVGPANTKAVVHIFGDLQCPACRAAEPGLEYAMQTYATSVRFVWNDFPLADVHPNAMAAANAARCAEEQGKFWEYRLMLYANQPEWADLANPTDKFSAYAQQAGLNTGAFNACLAAKKYQNKISDDMAEGNSNSVMATPTFFIGNKRFEGSLTNDQWDTELKALLGS